MLAFPDKPPRWLVWLLIVETTIIGLELLLFVAGLAWLAIFSWHDFVGLDFRGLGQFLFCTMVPLGQWLIIASWGRMAARLKRHPFST